MDYNLLQSHTIDIYDLKNHKGELRVMSARNLLSVSRFDLFAKLYYIDNIHSDPDRATRVYCEHIKAFNPDGKEPGRTDKNGVRDFVKSFNSLIETFRDNKFDDSISLVPIDGNGVILDGAHRVAALAYFNREVSVVQFNDIEAKCRFDYAYFKNCGLSWAVCDMIALEMMKWNKYVLAACIWPTNSKKQQQTIISSLSKSHLIAYMKGINCGYLSLTNFVRRIYHDQEWTLNNLAVQDKSSRIYGKSKLLIAFIESKVDINTLVAEKEVIRSLIGRGKDSLHITDNHTETYDIAKIVLKESAISEWQQISKLSFFTRFLKYFDERFFVFKKVQWIKFKVKIYNLLKKI